VEITQRLESESEVGWEVPLDQLDKKTTRRLKSSKSLERIRAKIKALLTVLTAHFAEKKDNRVLVFANIRSTAEILVERLKEREYRAVLFVGKGRRKGHRLGPAIDNEVLKVYWAYTQYVFEEVNQEVFY
jgi:ERCC4-related helicase